MALNKKSLAVFLLLLAMALAFAQSAKVYVTPSGKKYHYRDCRTLAKSKTVTAMTVAEAKKTGRTACAVCCPPEK